MSWSFNRLRQLERQSHYRAPARSPLLVREKQGQNFAIHYRDPRASFHELTASTALGGRIGCPTAFRILRPSLPPAANHLWRKAFPEGMKSKPGEISSVV
jgi:hypothetical protein